MYYTITQLAIRWNRGDSGPASMPGQGWHRIRIIVPANVSEKPQKRHE
jgi:hypothetical protein